MPALQMHMVAVCPNLQKRDLVSLTDFQTDLLELLVYRRCEHRSPVFSWTHNVVHQYRYIVAFMDELAHSSSLAQQACGELTPQRLDLHRRRGKS